MAKKPFIPVMIKKIAKPLVSISKHFDNYIEYPPHNETHWFEKLDCEKLTKSFGSPLFVVSEKHIKSKINQFMKFFQFQGYRTVIAYSVKTNYLPAICNVFFKENCWAEVVSGMEYHLARKLKVNGKKIIFNGPYKSDNELGEAVKNDSIIHIDNWDELRRLQEVAAQLKKKVNVGIRFNFAYFNYLWDKFGFHYDENNITNLLQTIHDDPYLEFYSIHNHCGTYILEPDVYAVGVNYIYNIAKIALKIGLKPKLVDLGGGFPSKAQLRQEYTGGYLGESAGLAAYADAISDGLKKIRKLIGEDLLLVFEPGRALIDEAVILISTVIANKKGISDSHITLVDAGVNILPTTCWYRREPQINSTVGQSYVKQRLCGPLCMQIDVLNEATYLPEMEPGMHMIIPNVGAYNHTQSMQFIQPRPATVMIGKNDDPTLIRRKETFDDIFIRDNFPK